MLTPTIFFNVVMGVLSGFQVFLQAFIMTGGGPGGATEILGTYMYKQGFIHFSMGYASTIAAVMFLIAFVCVVIIQIIEHQRKKRGLFT
jgi:raffinose/stachyose/melibiose transport system permease protein